MPKFSDTIQINADRTKVWSLLVNRDTILQWFEGLDDISFGPSYPDVGEVQQWSYKVMGVELKGTNTVLESASQSRIKLQMDGLMDGTMTYQLSDSGGGTKLEFEIDYKMSGGVLGKLAEPVAHQMNIGNSKKSMEKLKKLAES